MERKVTYTMLGDSVSMGYVPYAEKLFPKNYEHMRREGTKEAFMNLDLPVGANCGDSGRLLEYIEDYARDGALKRDFYTVNCGLHDVKVNPETGTHQIEIEDYGKNLRALFEIFVRTGKEIYWITTTDVDDETHNSRSKAFFRYHKDIVAYNSVAVKVCEEYGIPVIDLYTFTRKYGREAFRDHVHYPAEISEEQAKFIVKFVMEHRGNK